MTKDKKLKIFADGGARGNPGPAASAFVVVREGKVIYKQKKYLGHKTNNQAEHFAVLMAFVWLEKNKETINESLIEFFLDSELVVNQLSGVYKVKSNNLKTVIIRTKELEKLIGKAVKFQYIKREKNKKADKLVNESLDENV